MRASPQLDVSVVARLHNQAQATRWGLSVEDFRSTLEASVDHAFRGQPTTSAEIDRYLSSLHLRDLALAAACAAGHEPAWDYFVREHRPVLYRAADAIDPTGGAREVADSLYADLFGLRERDGVRQALFRYFHGRSSIATWLRAVLAQRHVDRLRAGRKLDPLPDEDSTPLGGTVSEADPERARFGAAMRMALASAIRTLAPRDRLRLGCYYVQGLTLAAIGRMFGEHEATASRQLARARAAIRKHVERQLGDEHGLDAAAIAECFERAAGDAGTLDLANLVGAVGERKILEPDRSKNKPRGSAPADTPTASLAGTPEAPLRSADSLAAARSFHDDESR